MSTIKEIGESKVTITMKPKENVLQSLVKDFITFSMVAFCVYISQGSTWWTFVTGLLFLSYLWIRLASLVKQNCTTFQDKQEAIKYLESLES